MSAARQANYKDAIAQLEDAAKLKPNDPRPLSALGWVNYKANRLDDAANRDDGAAE